MTVSEVGHPATPDDPQASLRLELVGQLVAAQFALEGALAELVGNSAALGQAQLQLAMLATLRQQIGTASPATLYAMSNEIVAAVAQTQSVIQQGRANLTNSEASSASSTAKARQLVQSVADDLFRQKLLDPYLEFSSAKDEEEYRKREKGRNEQVDRAMALRTPEGNRRAVELVQEQLRDAGAHGADRSPEFGRLINTASEAQELTAQSEQQGLDKTKPPPSSDVASIAATLRVAGLSGPPPEEESGHGLNFDRLALASREHEGRC